MTKYFYVAVVAVLVAMAALAGDFGHSAGQVIKTWGDQVEVQATRTPAPLTTVIYKGGDN